MGRRSHAHRKLVLPVLLLILSGCADDQSVEQKFERVSREFAPASTLDEFQSIAERNGLKCEAQLECLNSCQGSFAENHPDTSTAPDREIVCFWTEESNLSTVVWGSIRAVGYAKDGKLVEQDVRTFYTGP